MIILKYIFVLLFCYCEVNADKRTCRKFPESPGPTALSSLRKKLKCKYDTQAPPVNATNPRVKVNLYMDRHRLEYTATSDHVFLYTYIVLVWQDDRLKWNKAEFQNRTSVYMKMHEIWTPDLIDRGNGYFGPTRYAMVTSSGEVTCIAWWEISNPCKPAYAKWADMRICPISFQMEPADKLFLGKHFLMSSPSWYSATSWGIVDVKEKENGLSRKANDSDPVPPKAKLGYSYGIFTFEIHLLRNTAVMDATLFSPAVVLFILVLASTWIPCSASIRLALLALTTLLEIFLMHFASRAIPTLPGRFSDFAVLYRDLMIVSGVAFLEWYIAYMMACKKLSSSGRLQSVAGTASQTSYAFTRCVLLIPSNPPTVSNGTPEGAFLSVILDRITFMVIFLVFVIEMISEHPYNILT